MWLLEIHSPKSCGMMKLKLLRKYSALMFSSQANCEPTLRNQGKSSSRVFYRSTPIKPRNYKDSRSANSLVNEGMAKGPNWHRASLATSRTLRANAPAPRDELHFTKEGSVDPSEPLLNPQALTEGVRIVSRMD